MTFYIVGILLLKNEVSIKQTKIFFGKNGIHMLSGKWKSCSTITFIKNIYKFFFIKPISSVAVQK